MNQREREAMQLARYALKEMVAHNETSLFATQVDSSVLSKARQAANTIDAIFAKPDEQMKPLTVEQINNLPSAKGVWWPYSLAPVVMRIIREVEQAHGIKEQK